MKLGKLVCLFLFLLLSVEAAAQKNGPEPFEISSDTATLLRIPHEKWQYLKETDRLTFKQVQSKQYQNQFKKINYNNAPLDTYWVRYKVRNRLNVALDITIAADGANSETYIGLNGKWNKYLNGDEIPWRKRAGLKAIRHVVYTIPANSTISVYRRIENVPGVTLYHDIGIKENVIKAFYIENDEYYFGTVINSCLFGFLAFAALCNFFFFYINRERIYFIYALALLASALYFFVGQIFNLVLREYPVVFYRLQPLIFASYIILVFLTILLFLKVDKYHRLWFKLLLIGTGIIAAVSITSNFWWNSDFIITHQKLISAITRLIVVIVLTSIVIIIGIDIFKKRRTAKIFMIAITPLLVSSVVPFVFTVTTPYWVRMVILASVVWTVVVMSWSLFDRFRAVLQENMQQALNNERLAREKEEERNALIAEQNERLERQVAERTADLTQSLNDLKQTQNQLIQSEKMASLGELTAGIAHEIQNPLNFVNNFSDVSVELLAELKEELDKGDLEEVAAIADDVSRNLEKIAHHGRRADGIVKGMLQHSRASSGQKEPTDINALADEYLRLAYHGLRAKDKSFNAELATSLEQDLPKIFVVPQDIGRVLLNLFTNAFYATQQKKLQSGTASYNPTVEVATKMIGESVEISVKDNGTGIPDVIKDKILQPFFTTKPTGEGTGLGLSLSYDIVVKSHGGKIKINSAEGEGSEFIITLLANGSQEQ